MRLKSIETTPNPNSMKLNVDASFARASTYTEENSSGCPHEIKPLLAIEGVKSVFVCADFITLNRDPRADWRPLLEKATAMLGGANSDDEEGVQTQRESAQKEGQVQILVQTFRGIPIQVKALEGEKEFRISLGERFNAAAQQAQNESGADFLKERYWADHGVRYGPLEEMANEVAEELRGTFDQNRLDHIKDAAPSVEILKDWLNDEDWHRRLTAVQMLADLDNSVPMLAVALKDENPQVRRFAAAALGTTGSGAAVAPLADALLHDQSVGVRRTAGDALSDIGDTSAEPAVSLALSDSNKLVRWRAARFLSDVGTELSLPYLEAAAEDAEFEVRLEVEAAMQRIRGGAKGAGPVWKRIIGQG